MGQGVGDWQLEIGNWSLEIEAERRWQRPLVGFTSTHLCFSFVFCLLSFLIFHFSYFIFHISKIHQA
jgi:hypothetical protein